MFRRPVLALDLGSENTRISSAAADAAILSQPTLVVVDEMRESILAFGEAARRMVGRVPPGLRVTSPITEGVIANPELAERMLSRLIRRNPVGSIRRPHLVVAVPAAATSVQRHALKMSASIAGAGRSTLLKETLAAGLGAGLPVFGPNASLIVEMGASKTEMAVLALGGTVAARSVPVGGAHVSDAITSHLRREHHLLIGRPTADALKVSIGCAIAASEPVTIRAAGRDARRGVPDAVEVKSTDLVEPIQAVLDQVVTTIRELLDSTPPEPSADIAQAGIHLTGGASRLSGLPSFLERATGLVAHSVPDPENAVVKGCLSVARSPELVRAIEPLY